MFSKKWSTPAISIAAFFLISLTAGAAVADKTKITYSTWHGNYKTWAPIVKYQEEGFEARFPNADFVRNDVSFDQALEQLTVSNMGENAADIFHLLVGWVPALHAIDGLEPLNKYFPQDYWNNIPKVLMDSVTFDGQVMAMQFNPGPIMMYYNRELFKQAGLDPNRPPQDWKEFKEYCLKISKLPPVGGAPIYGFSMRTIRSPNSAQWSIPIIYGHGGDLFENGEVKINTAGTRAAYKMVQDLVKAKAIPSGFSIADSRNTFSAGRAGIIFEGPWGRGLFKNLSGGKMLTGPDKEVWISEMPKGPDGIRKTTSNSNHIGIYKGSKNKELAAKFIDFVVNDKKMIELIFDSTGMIGSGNVPLIQQSKLAQDEHSQICLDALKNTIDVPIKHPKYFAILDAMAPGLQKIMTGADIDKELTAVDRKVKRILR